MKGCKSGVYFGKINAQTKVFYRKSRTRLLGNIYRKARQWSLAFALS